MIQIGDSVTFRSLKVFLDGATTYYGRQYLIDSISRLAETSNLILIEVRRTSKQKWQVIEICTEDNMYNLEDEDIFLKAEIYNTKMLLNAKPTKWSNELLGEQVENRAEAEQ